MEPYFKKIDASDYIMEAEEKPVPEVELKSASEAEIRMVENYFNNSPLSGPNDTISVDNGVIFKIDEKLFAYTAAVKTTVDEAAPGDSRLGIPEGVADIAAIKTLVELSEDGSSVKKSPQQTLRDNNLHIPTQLIRASLKDHQKRWTHPGSDAWNNFLDTHNTAEPILAVMLASEYDHSLPYENGSDISSGYKEVSGLNEHATASTRSATASEVVNLEKAYLANLSPGESEGFVDRSSARVYRSPAGTLITAVASEQMNQDGEAEYQPLTFEFKEDGLIPLDYKTSEYFGLTYGKDWPVEPVKPSDAQLDIERVFALQKGDEALGELAKLNLERLAVELNDDTYHYLEDGLSEQAGDFSVRSATSDEIYHYTSEESRTPTTLNGKSYGGAPLKGQPWQNLVVQDKVTGNAYFVGLNSYSFKHGEHGEKRTNVKAPVIRTVAVGDGNQRPSREKSLVEAANMDGLAYKELGIDKNSLPLVVMEVTGKVGEDGKVDLDAGQTEIFEATLVDEKSDKPVAYKRTGKEFEPDDYGAVWLPLDHSRTSVDAFVGYDSFKNVLENISKKRLEVANEEKRKHLASADDPRPGFREELGSYLLWQNSLDAAKEKLALDIEAANKQVDPKKPSALDKWLVNTPEQEQESRQEAKIKEKLAEHKVLAQKMVLEPELFVVERSDKSKSQGEVSPVSAKDMALMAKDLQAGEFMKLGTISGAGIYAPNKDVKEVAHNSHVIRSDEVLYKSVRVKAHFSDPEYTDIHIVSPKGANQYHILAERIDEAGMLVSKNKEALEAVGIEPSILSKNLKAQGVQSLGDFASQLEPFAIRSNMIEGQFKSILAKTIGNIEIPEPGISPHVSIRQLSDEYVSQSQRADRQLSTVRARELKDNDLRLLNAISNNYSGNKRIVGGSVAKMTSESGNVDFIVAMQTYNQQTKASDVMTASLSRNPNSQTLKEGSSNGFKADQSFKFMLQEAIDKRAADPMGYSAIDPAVVVGLDGERVPTGQPKLNTDMLMTQVQLHSPDYVLPGNREYIVSKPEYRGDGISSELRNTNSDNDLERAHAHDLTGIELPDVSASPGMMRPGR